jgi:kynureninase
MTLATSQLPDYAARTYAEGLDLDDPLRRFRDEFHFPLTAEGHPETYLMGNSLGLQPKRTESFVAEELAHWRTAGVRGHHEGAHPWMPYHEFLAAPMGRIVGGRNDEVVVMNSLTTNLHLMLATFYRPRGKRTKILIEWQAFPSDRYAVESQILWHGLDPRESLLIAEPCAGEVGPREDELLALMERHADEIAVAVLPGVQYYSGQALDISRITREAQRLGIIAGWDLAHAVGNLPLDLHGWNVDFAVWCCYKYLNSGPGAVGGCFIHERHVRNTALPRLAGWWGHDKSTRFQMPDQFAPIPTAEGWQVSNPPILAMAAIRAALEVFDDAGGMGVLRQKSEQLTGYLIQLLDFYLAGQVDVLTPREPSRRGCQLSLRARTPRGSGWLCEQLSARGVSTDYRHPDVLRAAAVPLYNSFVDVWTFVQVLRDCFREARS